MFDTFIRSFALMKESTKILKQDKEMLLFPVVSSVIMIVLIVSFIIPAAFFGLFESERYLTIFFIIFGFYFICYFIMVYFNAALISCADMRINGKDPTFKDGIKNAWRHVGAIFLWALIAGTVGLILNAISRNSKSLGGKILIAIIGSAWTVLTFFVVPVLVIEGQGVGGSFKKSLSLIKKTWGENVIGSSSISLFFFVLGLIGLIPLYFAFVSGSSTILMIVLGAVILYWLILATISSSLTGIFVAAAYNYAATGKIPNGFDADAIKGAFGQEQD